MAKKSKVAARALLLSVEDVSGWILIARDDDVPAWNIAWLDPFASKKKALAFAAGNNWPGPYRAVRGRVTIDPV